MLIFVPVSITVLMGPPFTGSYHFLLLIMLLSTFPVPLLFMWRMHQKNPYTNDYQIISLISVLLAYLLFTICIVLICWLAGIPFSANEGGALGGRPIESSRLPLAGMTLIFLTQAFILVLTIPLTRMPKYVAFFLTLCISCLPIISYYDLPLSFYMETLQDESSFLAHLLSFFPFSMARIHYRYFFVSIGGLILLHLIGLLYLISTSRLKKQHIGIGALILCIALFVQFYVAHNSIVASNEFREHFLSETSIE
jgi:hypothetical protein